MSVLWLPQQDTNNDNDLFHSYIALAIHRNNDWMVCVDQNICAKLNGSIYLRYTIDWYIKKVLTQMQGSFESIFPKDNPFWLTSYTSTWRYGHLIMQQARAVSESELIVLVLMKDAASRGDTEVMLCCYWNRSYVVCPSIRFQFHLFIVLQRLLHRYELGWQFSFSFSERGQRGWFQECNSRGL